MAIQDFSVGAAQVEERIALVNPTHFNVSPMGKGVQLDLHAGVLDGRFACIQVLPAAIAKAAHKNRRHFLEQWPVARAKELYARAQELGDFFRAWKELTGSERPKTEAMFAEIRVRTKARSDLQTAGVHISDELFDNTDTETLQSWLRDPMKYRDDTIIKRNTTGIPDEVEMEVENDLEEELDLEHADRRTLWNLAKEMDIADVAKNINTEVLRGRVQEKVAAGQ